MSRLAYLTMTFLLLAPFVFAVDPGIVNYTKYSGNPLKSHYLQPNNYTYNGSITETSTIIEGRSVLVWFREGETIYMLNTSDYRNLSVPQRYRTDLPYRMFYQFVVQQPARYKGNFTMIVTNWSEGTPRGALYAFTSQNGTHWTPLCDGEDIGEGYTAFFNPALAHIGNGTYLLADDHEANRPRYYNSSGDFYHGLCTLEFQGYSLTGALNPWMGVFNDTNNGKQTFLMEYTYRYDGGNYRVDWAKGPDPLNFVIQNNTDLLKRSQSWEMTNPDDQADMDLWIVPPESINFFPVSWGEYYNGDQANTGLATDLENRTFYEAHNVTAILENKFCGDTIISDNETCDDGTQNGICPSSCSSTCTQQSCVSLQEPQDFNMAVPLIALAVVLTMITGLADQYGSTTIRNALIGLIGLIITVAVLMIL